MVSFSTGVDISLPKKRVWGCLTSYSDWKHWLSVNGKQLKSSNLLVDNNGKGDIVRCFLDADTYADVELIHSAPDTLKLRLLRIRSEQADNVTASSVFTLEEKGNMTALSNTTIVELGGMLGIATPLLTMRGRRVHSTIMKSFKRYAESR